MVLTLKQGYKLTKWRTLHAFIFYQCYKSISYLSSTSFRTHPETKRQWSFLHTISSFNFNFLSCRVTFLFHHNTTTAFTISIEHSKHLKCRASRYSLDIYTPLMRFYLALQQMQTDLAHEIWFCLTESVRALLK